MASDSQTVSETKKLLLVDGSGYIFRAFHALPMLTRTDGTPVGAVRGYMSMMLKLLEGHKSDYIAVIFDAKGPTFRKEIYDAYKANRPPPPEELVPQFGLVRDATRALKIHQVELTGFEADDLIATYAKQGKEQGLEVVVVSSDKDLMQLVGDGVTMLDPMKNRSIDIPEVEEKFGVKPDRVVDVQSLAGDSVDNVPGVPGIGIKTAALLINEYGDLDTLLTRASEIKQNKRRENLIEFADQARISRDLVRLKDDIEGIDPISDFVVCEPDSGELVTFLEEMEFKSIAERLGMSIAAPTSTANSNEIQSEEFKPVKESDYELITTEAQLLTWIDKAYASRILAVDTETTGLDATRAELVGISLATAPGEACYIPLAHKSLDPLLSDAPAQINFDRAIDLLRPVLTDQGVIKLGHNLKYDLLVLKKYDVDISPIDDTMVMSYVLQAGLHAHNLDDLANRFLDHTNIKFSEVAGVGKKQVTFDYVSLEKALDYAAEDADVAIRLHSKFKPRLATEKVTNMYQTIERPLIKVLCDMENVGIKVDRAKLHELSTTFAKKSGVLQEEIFELAGEQFNIGSPKQLGEILFNRLGLEGGKKSKSGAYSTDAGVLDGLAAKGHEIASKIVAWRQVNKLKSTYTDALQEQINPATGRVHTSYGMAIASTGRLSSTDPNLQNIPVRTEEGREIRQAFIAEEGHVLLSIDYSQIELRLTAHMAEEQVLTQAFRDGLDIHAMTASQMFDVPIEGMDPMVRRQAKAINFGIIYGISAFGLANNLGIPQGEAKQFITSYFERFPAIQDYMKAAKEYCKANGYVSTLFGRKVHLPGIHDKKPMMRAFAERQAINAPIQGTSADIIKRAMLRMPAALKAANLNARMLLQVHDELLFEVSNEELEKTTAVARDVMEAAHRPVLDLNVPLIADAGYGLNWSEAH